MWFCLCLLIGEFSLAQQKSFQGQLVQAGRYQLFAVKALSQTTTGGQSAFDEVFILDSQTGRVWKYEPYASVGNDDPIGIPAGFEELVVDNLNGDSRLDQLKRVANAAGNLRKAKADLQREKDEKAANDMLKKARESKQSTPDPEPPK